MNIVITPDHLGKEAEAEFVRWLVDDGVAVTSGQAVAEVETSKVIVEIATPAAGLLTHVVAVGEYVELGTVIGSVRL